MGRFTPDEPVKAVMDDAPEAVEASVVEPDHDEDSPVTDQGTGLFIDILEPVEG